MAKNAFTNQGSLPTTGYLGMPHGITDRAEKTLAICVAVFLGVGIIFFKLKYRFLVLITYRSSFTVPCSRSKIFMAVNSIGHKGGLMSTGGFCLAQIIVSTVLKCVYRVEDVVSPVRSMELCP